MSNNEPKTNATIVQVLHTTGIDPRVVLELDDGKQIVSVVLTATQGAPHIDARAHVENTPQGWRMTRWEPKQ
jgi:hypothetical protein